MLKNFAINWAIRAYRVPRDFSTTSNSNYRTKEEECCGRV